MGFDLGKTPYKGAIGIVATLQHLTLVDVLLNISPHLSIAMLAGIQDFGARVKDVKDQFSVGSENCIALETRASDIWTVVVVYCLVGLLGWDANKLAQWRSCVLNKDWGATCGTLEVRVAGLKAYQIS